MSSTELKPYVVSSDVGRLMAKWAAKSGYDIPHPDYFKELNQNLGIFLKKTLENSVDVVSQEELKKELDKLARQADYPIISLDRAYVDDQTPKVLGFLDLTRGVDENLNDLGLQPRPGFPSVDQQINNFRTNAILPVALLDDVIFSGDGIVDICNRLKKVNRPVGQIIVGIGVGEGLEKLKALGIPVYCVREYPAVYDEICERDFFAGVPMSGRTVITSSGDVLSAPYFLPFGNPEKWASIPAERVKDYSEFCINQSFSLWRLTELGSRTQISTDNLPRRVRGLASNQSAADALASVLEKHAQN